MQSWSPDGVRQERTGWRDKKISERHREWGFDCPCVDLDFVVVEYNKGLPVGIVEYKHHQARMPSINHPTYRALKALMDGYNKGPLPFLLAFYWPDVWAFKVYPLNETAKGWFSDGETLTEYDYVKRLYTMRRYTLSESLKGKLFKVLPSQEAA